MPLRLCYLILSLLFLFACSGSKQETTHSIRLLTPELLFSERPHFIPFYDSLNQTDQQQLQEIYKQRNYSPLFYTKSGELTEHGTMMMELVTNSLYYGLPQNRIYGEQFQGHDSLPSKVSLVIKDAQLTLGVLRFFDDIKNGFSDSLKLDKKRFFHLANRAILDSLKTIQQPISLDSFVQRQAPQDSLYSMLGKALRQHLDTADVSVNLFRVPLTKSDSVLSYQNAILNLKRKKFPVDTTLSAPAIVRKFQKSVGISADGIINEATQNALQESPLDLAYRIAWNMEKARYTLNYPKHYIKVNIPEFKLYYFNKDTVVSINNVVVGKVEHKTPTLSARVYGIQTMPFWNVPHKIATKEILPAIKADKNYLHKNQMILLRGDKEIDPNSINWSKVTEKNFYYKVRQLPGEKNSLGIIKFEFYNKYDVYIHDTPQKRLLDYPNRTYSHGCVRCQNPVELGRKVLEIDDNKVIPDSLDSILGRKEQYLIRLKKQIPIYIEYNSVTVSPVLKEKKQKRKEDESKEYEWKVAFARDVYFTDEKIVHHFFGMKVWAN